MSAIPPAAVLTKRERQHRALMIEIPAKPKDEPLIWQDYNEGLQIFSWCQCGALKEQGIQHVCQYIEAMNACCPVLTSFVDKALISDTEPGWMPRRATFDNANTIINAILSYTIGFIVGIVIVAISILLWSK